MTRQALHREKILAAALRVFADKGYNEATVREIAGVAGVAVGALYPYFGSKEQLYVEVLKEEMAEYNERIREFADGDPQVGITRYIENHRRFMALKKEMVARHFKDYDLPCAKPIRRDFFDRQKDFLSKIIGKGVEQGIFHVADRGEAALFILSFLKGALFYDLADMAKLTRQSDVLCNMVLGFLKNRQDGNGHKDETPVFP